MENHVGRALDWLLCAIIAALLVLPLEMPTNLQSDLGTHSLGSGVAVGELTVLAEALRYFSPILTRLTGSYVSDEAREPLNRI